MDLVIIGSGPAGLAAAIYAARYKLDFIVLSKVTGGLANEAHMVENWPGEKHITGLDLMQNFKEHAQGLGATLVDDEALDISKSDEGFIVKTRNETYNTKAIILAMGTERRKLNIEGEKELLGKGVSYCATCDGPFFKDKTVAVVGGNDSAVMSAELLTQFAKKVFIIYRKENIRAEPTNLEMVQTNEKVEVINNANVTCVCGDGKVQTVKIDREYRGSNEIGIDGLFIEIGSIPNIVLTQKLGLFYDDGGYIVVNNKQLTNVPGLYAAGDITTNSDRFRQMITAAAEGAVAAKNVFDYTR